jgi:transcriptional regulator with XRE-family HTH domain
MSTKRVNQSIKELEITFGALTLSRFITAWRISADMNQRAFAKLIGISAANLCDIEKGRKGVSLYKATEIAKKIGYSPTALVQFALQEMVNSSGLNYQVEVKKRA